MSDYLEYTAVAFGIIYVLLATRSIIWCWLAGIISSAIYIYINIEHQLYQDAILQTYYVVAGFYGWWLWSSPTQTLPQGEGLNTKFALPIISFSRPQNFKLILLGAVLVPVFGYIFSKFGNALSYFDATVTVFSFIATWMTAKKILENWIFWIVIDLIAAVMYFIKGLHATSFLYIFFSVIAVYGYFEWKKNVSRKDAKTQS